MRVRTGYSFRSAVGMPNDVLKAIQEAGYPVAPISDRASTFGFVKWTKAAKKLGLRPVYGVELAVTASLTTVARPPVDHWTFFAIDSLTPINELVELATKQFRYEPLLTYKDAMNVEGVVKIAGHRMMFEYEDAMGEKCVNRPHEKMFVSLSPASNPGYIREAMARGFNLIASSDNRYPSKDDLALYEVIAGKRFVSTQSYPQHILSEKEWEASLQSSLKFEAGTPFVGALAWGNMLWAMDVCRAELRQATMIKPARPKTIRKMCEEGARTLGVDLNNPVYFERLERELKLIKEKAFEDYFYVIADVVQWARKEMWVGPARGSSCGSLVCYLTEITTIDPIKFGLIFERFIDINRNDLPDIDIDFSDQQRVDVFKYMEDKYGSEHVARLGTVALYQPRSAMSEAAMALDIPRWKTEGVLESLIERSSGDSRALQSLEDTLSDTPSGRKMLEQAPEIMIAAKMEGHPRHSSKHAAGIIITDEPVKYFVAVDARTGTTQCDKKDAEDLNFLKIDALGLTQGSVFEDTLKAIGRPDRFLETLPLDDPAAFEVLNKSQWSGIFQFNGQALQSICKQIKVDRLDDIVCITALARPGPLASGGTNAWVQRRGGKEAVTYPHPAFEPYLKDTLGIVAYQEQVMEIGRQIGDLSWEDVTALRKAMSKSLGKEFFDQYGNRWKEGATKRGIPKEVSEKIWDELCAYGSWAFNKSHAVAYGHISYQCCWLKAHHPFEFAAATLSHETDPMKMIMLLREMRSEGIDYIPFDKDMSSGMKWTTKIIDGRRVLVGPLSLIKDIGPSKIAAVEWNRANQHLDLSEIPLDKRLRKKLKDMTPEERADRRMRMLAKSAMTTMERDATTKVDSLWPIGDAFARLLPDPSARNIVSTPTPIAKIMEPNEEDAKYMIFAQASKIAPRNENEPQLVARRGYEIKGPLVNSLLLRMTDDTETIMCKIDRHDYEKLGREIVDRGRPGKSLYAMAGRVRGGSQFRMMMIEHVKYIGDTEQDFNPFKESERKGQAPYEDDIAGVAPAVPVNEKQGAL